MKKIGLTLTSARIRCLSKSRIKHGAVRSSPAAWVKPDLYNPWMMGFLIWDKLAMPMTVSEHTRNFRAQHYSSTQPLSALWPRLILLDLFRKCAVCIKNTHTIKRSARRLIIRSMIITWRLKVASLRLSSTFWDAGHFFAPRLKWCRGEFSKTF